MPAHRKPKYRKKIFTAALAAALTASGAAFAHQGDDETVRSVPEVRVTSAPAVPSTGTQVSVSRDGDVRVVKRHQDKSWQELKRAERALARGAAERAREKRAAERAAERATWIRKLTEQRRATTDLETTAETPEGSPAERARKITVEHRVSRDGKRKVYTFTWKSPATSDRSTTTRSPESDAPEPTPTTRPSTSTPTQQPRPTTPPRPTTQPQPTQQPSTQPSSGTGSGILSGTNAARTNAGVPALSTNACLTNMAQRHAERLAVAGRLYHQELRTVMSSCGMSTVGENVAMNHTGASAMVNQWMNSSGHRANMLNVRFSLIGIGVAQASNGAWYGVQVFGDN